MEQVHLCEEWGAFVYLPPIAHTRSFFHPSLLHHQVIWEQLLQGLSLFLLNFLPASPQSCHSLSLYITTSLVFLSLSSPWQWNTVTPISGVPRRQNTAVWLSHFPAIEQPACQHFFHSSTNGGTFPVPPQCFLSLSSSSLFSPLPSLTLPEDGSVKDKGQTKSQHSCEHLFCIGAPSLACLLALVLHFTFDFSVSVRGTPLRAASVWHATNLPKPPCWIKNTAYAALWCYKEQTYPLFRKWSTYLTWTARCLLI